MSCRNVGTVRPMGFRDSWLVIRETPSPCSRFSLCPLCEMFFLRLQKPKKLSPQRTQREQRKPESREALSPATCHLQPAPPPSPIRRNLSSSPSSAHRH